MSSFYEDASLVVIPSGYKTSKIYAEKPTDGSGDLTFTRASGATRVGPNGLIEEVRENLALYSEQFDNAYWGKNALGTGSVPVVTANNATAPDGTNTADRIVFNAGAGTTSSDFSVIRRAFTITNNQEYANSIYLRGAVGGEQIIFRNTAVGTIYLTLTTSWQRFTDVSISTSTSYNFDFGIRQGLSGGTINATATVFAWGAQFETGVATDYIPTTTAAVSVGPVSNVPRLDYLGSTCPRLNLEPQRTNVFPNSENTANWSLTNMTRTLNAGTSPDGYASADLLAATTSGAVTFTSDNTTITLTNGQPFVCSFFIKLGTSFTSNVGTNILDFRLGGTAVWTRPTIRLNLETGAVTNITNASYLSSTSFGNGWYRITFGGVPTASGTAIPLQIPTGATMTAGGSFYIWGLQGEDNASYATSYIPTPSTSAVTRVADAASKTGISSLIGQSEGTLFINPTIIHTTTTNEYFIQVRQSSSTRIFIYREANTNKIGCFALIGASTIYTALTAGAVTGTFKAAFAYKSGSFAFYVNGTQVGTSTATFTTPALTEFFIDQNDGLENGFHAYNQALLFKTRLTNAQLAELTTL